MPETLAKSRFEVIFDAEGVNNAKFRNDVKVHLRGPHAVSYDLPTDEGGIHGGDGTAPYPLAYFTSGLTACVMTQICAFSKRLGIPVGRFSVKTRCHWQAQQSGNQPYESAPITFTMDVDIEGDASEADKRRLLAAAEKGCFVEQSLKPGLVKHRLKVGIAGSSCKMSTEPLVGVRACVFDAYGTLFDYASAALRCRDVLGDKLDRLTTLWRDKQLQYTWLRATQERHADFWQVTGDALDYALGVLGIDDAALRDRLMSLYLTLDAFPEVPQMLERLKGAGIEDRRSFQRHTEDAPRRGRRRRSAQPDRRHPVGRGGRRLQAASESLSARGRPARCRAVRDRIPVVECLGCLCRLRVRNAGGLVQPLRLSARAAARRARSRGDIARGIARTGRSPVAAFIDVATDRGDVGAWLLRSCDLRRAGDGAYRRAWTSVLQSS